MSDAKKEFLEDAAKMWDAGEGRVILIAISGEDGNNRFDLISTVEPDVCTAIFTIMATEEPDLVEPLDLDQKGAVH